MARVDPQVKALLATRLRGLRSSGQLTTAVVRTAAREVGVSDRSVWKWIAMGSDGLLAPVRRRGYELSEADVDAFVDWQGNVAAVHRALHAGRTGSVSLRRLQEAFAEQLTPGQRAGLVEGAEGRRRHEVYLRWAPSARNALWEADHVELGVWVLAPRAQRPAKPWATLFIDGYSRLIVGWAISIRPSSATVLAALRSGIVVDPERGPFGGAPAALRPDWGREFTAEALRRACAALGIEIVPAPPYRPHRKGKVERVNRTLGQEFLTGLPFSTTGPRDVDGTPLLEEGEPLGLGLFVARFADYIRHYNTERAHSELGTTPLARWGEDASPLRTFDAAELRWMLLADMTRTVNRDGIHFDGVRFIAPELNELVGEQVEVRYTPHDLRQIEVFRHDRWLATAYPQDTLSEEQRVAVLARRRDDAAELARHHRRARRRARARLAPITAPGPDAVVDTTVITSDAARAEASNRRRRRGDEGPDYAALARLARTDLLDLKSDFAYWNPDLADPDRAADAAPAAPVELDPPPSNTNTDGSSDRGET